MSIRSLSFLTCLSVLFAVASSANGESIYSGLVIDNTSPVLYWDLDETTGSTADDLVATHDGTYLNVTLGNAGPRPSDGFANMASDNRAPTTAGAGMARYTALNSGAGVGTNSYSAQVWFNSSVAFDEWGMSYVLGRSNDDSSGSVRDSVYVGGTYTSGHEGKLALFDGTNAYLNGTTVLDKDTWYHVALVREDVNNVSIYLNGELEFTCASTWQGGDGDYFSAGHRPDDPTYTYNIGLIGNVDESAVWNKALNSTEVQNLHDYAVPEPTTFALIATGALGFLLVALRRRRQ